MGRARIERTGATEFGRRVRARRKQLGMTQLEVALKVRNGNRTLDTSYLSDVERGKRNIGLENILILAEALDTDPARLVQGLKPDRRP